MDFDLSRKSTWGLIIAVGIIGLLLICWGRMFETNSAGFMQVKQAAITGNLSCKSKPGMYLQLFGDIFTYPEATTFYFTVDKETGEKRDQSLPTRFNDGARASVSGSVRVILPTDCEDLKLLHRKFKSAKGVMAKLVLPAVRKALFNTGPHMSAAESFAERRGEFAALVENQLVNGIILVEKIQEIKPDLITGENKKIWVLVKKRCSVLVDKESCIDGYLRDRAAFLDFNVKVINLVIDNITYSPKVLEQIETQRKARMDIITQQAQAKQAEARAAKANAEAKAQIAETRAKEEVQKTQRVVRAEADKEEAILRAQKKKEVAFLDLAAAELEKKANILRGEGEASRRRAIMHADGALSQKLEVMAQIHQYYADALAHAKPGALVPQTVIGQGKSSSANDLIQLLLVKTAKDLNINSKLK